MYYIMYPGNGRDGGSGDIGRLDMGARLTPFHVAVQVRDITEARNFYGHILGCTEGRRDTHWVDFNLYGHQFVCHLNPTLGKSGTLISHYNRLTVKASPYLILALYWSCATGMTWLSV
jgi:hypothetical protein